MTDPTRSPAPALSVRGLTLRYGETTVLDGIDLDLAAGKVLALLGPSGCGKTTFLRLISGLLMPSEGRLEIAGRPVADPRRALAVPPDKRGLGMVFQDYALWPHLSVARNVAFPLQMMRLGGAEIEARVRRALSRVGLAHLAERRPSDLSGGQQQRVAIARAIVAEPPLVLFDEPLSNLDRELRETMVEELAALVTELRLSAVYVTHDQAEALALADQIAVMRAGRIEQLAAPETLIAEPETAAVADFLRLGALIPARRGAGGWVIEGTDIALPAPAAFAGDAAQVLLPERALSLGGTAENLTLPVQVLSRQIHAAGYRLHLRIAGTDRGLHLNTTQPARRGETLTIGLSAAALRWFPPGG